MDNINNVVEIMDKEVAAYNERNIEKFLNCFAEDIEFFTLKDNKRTLSGKIELKNTFDKLFSNSPNLDLKIKNRIVSGNYVTDLEVVHGSPISINGAEAIAINFIEHGLIRKIWFSEVIPY